MSDRPVDLFITATEINDRHGVGILLGRYFPDNSEAVSLRSRSQYNGVEPFGRLHWELQSCFLTLEETEARLRQMLIDQRIGRILTVPYYREDFIHAVLAKRITGAPLCVFVMDDQNIFTHEVPDRWVSELLNCADLRLGISPELCEAYRLKFGRELHVMPPVLAPGPEALPNHWIRGKDTPFTCAMIGNVWKKAQFERLRTAIREAGIRVHWFGNGVYANWLEADQEALHKDGIDAMGFIEEATLSSLLSSYPLVLVPSGTLDNEDDNPSFSRLSLPSRILFLATRANVPILVVGHGESAAGRFVRRLRIGNCCGYSAASLWEGIRLLTDKARHPKLCRNLRSYAPLLMHPEPGTWIWNSLEDSHPQRAPWLKAFAPRRTWYGRSLEVPPPLDVSPYVPKPRPEVPRSWQELGPGQLAAFSYTCKQHLTLAFPPDEVGSTTAPELGVLLEKLIEGMVSKLGPPGGRWLFLGLPSESLLRRLPTGTQAWAIRDLDAWQAAMCTDEPQWFSPLNDAAATKERPHSFDVFASVQIGSFIKEADTLKFGMWNDFLVRCSAPGALHAHAFTAILHPTYFWRHALLTSMEQAFPGACRTNLDEILSDPDLWTMDKAAYDEHWISHIKKPFHDFGRPLGLILAWHAT